MSRSTPTLQALELICHGYSAFDFNILMDGPLEPNSKQPAKAMSYNGGGVAANIAVAASRLGCQVGFSGFISTDPFGEVQYQGLQKEGVNLELTDRDQTPSPLAVIIGSNGQPPALLGKFIDQPPAPRVNNNTTTPKVILIDGHNRKRSMEWLAFAKDVNATTVLDAGYFTPDLEYLSRNVDIVISSREFAEQFAQAQTPVVDRSGVSTSATTLSLSTILSSVSQLSNRFIVTLDREGTAWNWEGRKGVMAPWQTHCVDGTGAGDAFHGAFCYGLIKQLSLAENLLLSSAAGAICCQGLGVRETLPDLAALNQFMASQNKPEVSDI